jgi:hypothetical protein
LLRREKLPHALASEVRSADQTEKAKRARAHLCRDDLDAPVGVKVDELECNPRSIQTRQLPLDPFIADVGRLLDPNQVALPSQRATFASMGLQWLLIEPMRIRPHLGVA